jgi:penicillin-binding protein 1A
MDVWFSGYNRDVVTTTWVGFDNYTPLGRKEFGGTAALPIWIEYMREALKDSPQQARPVPPGIVTVKIDPETGQLTGTDQRNAIFEYFRNENVPKRYTPGQENPSGGRDVYEQINNIF